LNTFLNWLAVLWLAGAACYAITITDGYRRKGFGGSGDRRSRRHGRNQPRTDGSASGSFHRRFS
jgi:hypothetical protein